MPPPNPLPPPADPLPLTDLPTSPHGRHKGHSGRNLRVRLLSSALGIPALLAVIFVEIPGVWPALLYLLTALFCAYVSGWEFFGAARHRVHPHTGAALFSIMLVQLSAYAPTKALLAGWVPLALTLLLLIFLVREVTRVESAPLANIGVTTLGVAYAGWLFSHLVLLRMMGATVDGNTFTLPPRIAVVPFGYSALGAWLVVYVFAVTWSMDTSAFFVGRQFAGRGRWGRLLLPRLSPSKTVAGSVGGLVGGTVVSVALGTWIGLPVLHTLALGPLLGVAGQVGDLWASSVKREVGLKDFGGFVPGHGGLLDRMDSMLFSAPCAYYYLVYLVYPVQAHG